MEKIVSLAHVELVILLSPFLSYMLWDFMQDGMIFQRWGKFLETIPEWIAKPLGGCLKCFHVWVVIFLSIYLQIDFINFLISLGVSYVILYKLFYD